MVHEMLGVKNNRIDMSTVPNIRKDLHQIVLDCAVDSFYNRTRNLNYADLLGSINELIGEYKRKTQNNQKISSIDDMKKFIEQFPEFRSLQTSVSKHLAVQGELSRLVDLRSLLTCSELEQELACEQNHSAAVEGMLKLLDNQQIRFREKLRLVLLYSLRYENISNQMPQFRSLLKHHATSDADLSSIAALQELPKYAGANARGGDLFGNKSFFKRWSKKLFPSGMQGETLYTQHKPLLFQILDAVSKGKLSATDFPLIGGGNVKAKPRNVIVFIVGGATYEEAQNIAALNASTDSDMRIVLGGSCIHNSTSFLNDVTQKIGGSPFSPGGGASGSARSVGASAFLGSSSSEKKSSSTWQ
jgi:vacuolar protein sorting-associated protein 45